MAEKCEDPKDIVVYLTRTFLQQISVSNKFYVSYWFSTLNILSSFSYHLE